MLPELLCLIQLIKMKKNSTNTRRVDNPLSSYEGEVGIMNLYIHPWLNGHAPLKWGFGQLL